MTTLALEESAVAEKEHRSAELRPVKAWVAESAKGPMTLETVDLGPLGDEEVEVAVEHCGLCHSDLSVLNDEWGISQYPAVLGERSVSGSPTGSPAVIRTMLDFAVRHGVAPQTEHFPMSRINDAFARLESGKARYRIVLDADF